MRRRFTVSEQLWPNTLEFLAALHEVTGENSAVLLQLVWQGIDALAVDLRAADLTGPLDDLERDLTQLLEKRIRRAMSGHEAFELQHGPFERESRLPAPAQPPTYDLAFSLRANERVMWPVEAKVLPTPNKIGPYVRDVRQEFLTCRYSPFSREAAMVGYLLTGGAEEVFANVATALEVPLASHPQFRGRNHRTSEHQRTVPQGCAYPVTFRCHHLICLVSSSNAYQQQRRRPRQRPS